MAVTDATTLPRARVLEVTRRLDGSTTRLAIKVQLLATGEEKEIDDRGGGPISIAADVQQGDLLTLTPSGPHTFRWQKSVDATTAQLDKPKKKRRPFTVDDLLSPLGVSRILATFPGQRWKGYGHERDDVARLVWLYKVWMSEMFPHAHPAVLTRRMEVMGGTRRVQRYMDVFRYEGRVKGEREEREKRQKVDEETAAVRQKEQLEQDAAMQLMDEVYGTEQQQQQDQDAMEQQLLQQHEDGQDEQQEEEEEVEPPVGQGSSFDEAMRQLGLLPPLPATETALHNVDADGAVLDEEEQGSEAATKPANETDQQPDVQQSEMQRKEFAQLDESVPHTPPPHGSAPVADFDTNEHSGDERLQQHELHVDELAMVPETLEHAAGELDLSPHESAGQDGQSTETAKADKHGNTAQFAAPSDYETDEIPSSLTE